jgi:hypothetical protein
LLNTTADRGSSFRANISAADLVLRTTNPAILREYDEILLDQSARLKRLQTPEPNELSGGARAGC